LSGLRQRWIDPVPVEVPPEVWQASGEHPLLAAALARRGIRTAAQVQAFLDPALYSHAPPADLPDLERAANRIEQAIRCAERIGVWGDFDMDGQTSTTLLVSSLRRLGADVVYYIPVRGRESHGIALPSLQTFLERGVRLLLTCDTGITANDAIIYAAERGVETIITDHHILPPELPSAFAVVNPQRLAQDHPLWPLCGVGCAYKLVEELHRRAGRLDELEQDHDLVALGTVADLALLTGDNRCLVQQGLMAMRSTPRLAIQSMLNAANGTTGNLNEESISFLLAPRLNALGRLGDANPVVDFLTTTDNAYAQEFAARLEALNNRRKLLTDQVLQGALAQIEREPEHRDAPVLVLSHPNWPGGVLGIAASRLVELFHRPAILIANPPGEMARGSCRSVAGIHITSALAENQDLLLGFGGHTMAAGLGLSGDNIVPFRRAMIRTIDRVTANTPLVRELALDAYLPLSEVTLELVEQLERLAPFGPGNPSFVLAAKNVDLKSHQLLGKAKDHRQLIVEDTSGVDRKVIWWQGAGLPLPDGRFDLAYKVRMSDWRGQRDIQIEWVDARPTAAPVIELQPSPRIELTDLRHELDPFAVWTARRESGWILWREAEALKSEAGANRYQLTPHPILVIGSIPPGRQELAAAIETVAPRHIVLFGLHPSSDHPDAFFKRLAGLIQYTLRSRAGQVTLPELAAATGQREVTVQWGLDWMVARGYVTSIEKDAGIMLLSAGGIPDPDLLHKAERAIRALLEETAAFRDYYLKAEPSSLVVKQKTRS
jgi:single-stranded-DNA-specific exonuclease